MGKEESGQITVKKAKAAAKETFKEYLERANPGEDTHLPMQWFMSVLAQKMRKKAR